MHYERTCQGVHVCPNHTEGDNCPVLSLRFRKHECPNHNIRLVKCKKCKLKLHFYIPIEKESDFRRLLLCRGVHTHPPAEEKEKKPPRRTKARGRKKKSGSRTKSKSKKHSTRKTAKTRNTKKRSTSNTKVRPPPPPESKPPKMVASNHQPNETFYPPPSIVPPFPTYIQNAQLGGHRQTHHDVLPRPSQHALTTDVPPNHGISFMSPMMEEELLEHQHQHQQLEEVTSSQHPNQEPKKSSYQSGHSRHTPNVDLLESGLSDFFVKEQIPFFFQDPIFPFDEHRRNEVHHNNNGQVSSTNTSTMESQPSHLQEKPPTNQFVPSGQPVPPSHHHHHHHVRVNSVTQINNVNININTNRSGDEKNGEIHPHHPHFLRPEVQEEDVIPPPPNPAMSSSRHFLSSNGTMNNETSISSQQPQPQPQQQMEGHFMPDQHHQQAMFFHNNPMIQQSTEPKSHSRDFFLSLDNGGYHNINQHHQHQQQHNEIQHGSNPDGLTGGKRKRSNSGLDTMEDTHLEPDLKKMKLD